MPFSMTGFGAAEGDVGSARLRIEIRTVNHRFFTPALKLPTELGPLEGEFRERLRRDFDRGHIAVTARWVGTSPHRDGALQLDIDRAREAMARLRELQTAVGLAGDISIDLLARQPDVLRVAESESGGITWAEVEAILADATADCRAMRRREGDVLAAELSQRVDQLEELARRVEARAPERLVRERERLRAALAQLMDGRPVDEGRLVQELAVMADRLDLTEELVRLRTHLAAVRAALADERPLGKRLGFLAQELGREINTIGAKANDAEIAQQAIAMKGELEKFREQVENLE